MTRYAILAAAVALSGCADLPTKVDATLSSQNVQTGIQLTCATYTGLEAGWDVYAADHKVSDTALKAVSAARAAVGTICQPPYPQDTADFIARVTQAGVAVITALQEAQKEANAS